MIQQLLGHDHDDIDDLFAQSETALKAKDHEQALALLDLAWARLAVHIRAENVRLFPRILRSGDRLEAGQRERIASLIARLREDHNFFMATLAEAIKLARALSEDEGRFAQVLEKIEAVKRRLSAHNELEESMVYSLPAHLLDEAELEDLKQAVQRELENLPPRYARGGEID